MELWKLMHPAAGRVLTMRVSPLAGFRRWLNYKRGEYPWYARV